MHTNRDLFKHIWLAFKSLDIGDLFTMWESRLLGKPNDISDLLQFLYNSNEFLEAVQSYVLISDLKEMRQMYVSPSFNSITGHSNNKLLTEGSIFLMKLFCPADTVHSMNILNKINEHQKQPELIDKELYMYTTTFRSLHAKKYYSWYYNRMIFLNHDDNNKPTLLLSIVTSIDPFKTDENLLFTIEKYNTNTEQYDMVLHEDFLPEGHHSLSESDLRILKYIVQGMDNLQIGHEMGLTEHSIKDYRKKMLKKTWCSNTSELVCFALRNKLI